MQKPPPSPAAAFLRPFSRFPTDGRSILLVPGLVRVRQTGLYLRRYRLVVAEIHRIAPAAGGGRFQLGGIAFQLRQRYLRAHDDLAVARRIGAVDARALA